MKYAENWHETASKLTLQGKSSRQISDILIIPLNTAKTYIKRERRAGRLPKYKEEAKEELYQSKPKKFTIFENLEPSEYRRKSQTKTITFGLMGDTQFGSKYTQITYLKEFYDILNKRGIKECYHTGDITDGLKMRVGHEYELYEITADDIVEDIKQNYPTLKSGKTYFITGNHDSSIYKQCGFDIGRAISEKRSDLVYLGRDCARIELAKHCILELRHPWDGSAYSISYKPQKMIEAMEADSKPNILAIGHYHKAEYLFYRNIHCFQTGCFQSQTPFTRGKGISVHMGGWIVTIDVDANGYIQRIVPEFIPFYKAIKDDYKNYKII